MHLIYRGTLKIIESLFILLLVTSCADRNVKPVPSIDLQNPDKSGEIKLSELIGDIRVIKLETRDSIMLGPETGYLVSDKYIISVDQDKILQFSGDGAFMRILAKSGKGPEEFVRADVYAMDAKKDILYINHRGDSHHIVSYDLKNGQRSGRIPTGTDNLISQIIVSGDSILTIVPRMSKEYNFYYLTTSGKFISGIAPPKARNIGLETSVGLVNKQLFYMPKEYDTLYVVDNISSNPYCFFLVDNRFAYDNNETGNFVYLSSNAPGYVIANKVHARIKINSDGETFSMNADTQVRYLISKKDFSVCEITDFNNDFLGFSENQDQWDNYLFITNDMGHVCYSAFELKQKIREALDNGKADDQIRNRISDLYDQIGENDNPVILAGQLKADI